MVRHIDNDSVSAYRNEDGGRVVVLQNHKTTAVMLVCG